MLYAILAAVLVALDQLVKYLVVQNIPLGEHVPFLPCILDLTYVQNTGAAFSLFSDHTWILALISLVMSVLLAIAVAAVTLAVLSVVSSTASPLGNVVGVITSPFRSAAQSVADWHNEKQDYFADNKALRAENEELKRQIAEMKEDVRDAQTALDENARYREMLGLREKHRSFDLESARVLNRDRSNWTSSLTLNHGTDYGIAGGDCVITERYELVGVVSEAGYNWCTVLTLIDTDSSLGARVFRTGDVGLAQGDFTLMSEGLLELSYLPNEGSQLLPGDLVLTSGLGGYYPADLPIGSVREVRTDDSGAASYAVVEPAAELDALKEKYKTAYEEGKAAYAELKTQD